jgi:hypothetical protein
METAQVRKFDFDYVLTLTAQFILCLWVSALVYFDCFNKLMLASCFVLACMTVKTLLVNLRKKEEANEES